MTKESSASHQLGLKQNWKQFTLLIIINAFIGGMVGMERTIFPKLAEEVFGLEVKSIILSFIVVFGITKAFANYFAGRLANKIGRKNLLSIGWLFAIPVPFLLMFAPSWKWVVFANVLLGINQGLAWSTNVLMNIDLVGDKDRGLAMGFNEFAGYLSVAIVAFMTGWIASEYGLRPFPFYIGIALSWVGLISTILLVKDTGHFVHIEAQKSTQIKTNKNIFMQTTIRDKNLSSVTQAGMVNNLNDGMIWGVLPILLASQNYTLNEIAVLTASYPGVWGISQLFTGKLSDHINRKKLLFWGMFMQGIVLLLMVFANSFIQFLLLASFLGLGTAMVYPTFLASIADLSHPHERAESIGVFRLWRDGGYAFGAIITGIISDYFNINTAITLVGILTVLSAVVIQMRMKK